MLETFASFASRAAEFLWVPPFYMGVTVALAIVTVALWLEMASRNAKRVDSKLSARLPVWKAGLQAVGDSLRSRAPGSLGGGWIEFRKVWAERAAVACASWPIGVALHGFAQAARAQQGAWDAPSALWLLAALACQAAGFCCAMWALDKMVRVGLRVGRVAHRACAHPLTIQKLLVDRAAKAALVEAREIGSVAALASAGIKKRL